MAKIPVKKLNDGTSNYFPVSVLDSVFLNKEIQVKNTVGGITKGTTLSVNTSLHTIINNLLGVEGTDLDELLSLKVDKEDGKGLSTNDYDDDAVSEVAKITDKLDKTDSVTSVGSIASKNFWTGTQSQYDSIETPDPNTLYFISE